MTVKKDKKEISFKIELWLEQYIWRDNIMRMRGEKCIIIKTMYQIHFNVHENTLKM